MAVQNCQNAGTNGEEEMNIKKYKFKQNQLMCATTDKKLLIEAKERGFYGGHTPYNSLFSELFFNGGKLNYKSDLDKNFKREATDYLRSFMGSFEPKYEEKEAISALILSELVNIN